LFGKFTKFVSVLLYSIKIAEEKKEIKISELNALDRYNVAWEWKKTNSNNINPNLK